MQTRLPPAPPLLFSPLDGSPPSQPPTDATGPPCGVNTGVIRAPSEKTTSSRSLNSDLRNPTAGTQVLSGLGDEGEVWYGGGEGGGGMGFVSLVAEAG